MQLTVHTDLALRILLYLATDPTRQVSARAISRAFDVSSDHTSKAAKTLVHLGMLSAKRGREGGLMLAHDPASVRIGRLVEQLESLKLVDCDPCIIAGGCHLQEAFQKATRAFLNALDEYTLADLVANKTQLVTLLRPIKKRSA